jgi:hypothetical protein
MRRQKQAREHAAQAVLFDRLEWQLTELRGHLDRAATGPRIGLAESAILLSD